MTLLNFIIIIITNKMQMQAAKRMFRNVDAANNKKIKLSEKKSVKKWNDIL